MHPARVCVALDVASENDAVDMVRLLQPGISLFKIGLELFCAAGPSVVRRIRELGVDVFLDLKFHDIPNTVRGAVASASRLGPMLMTVHASGGLAMMRAAAEEVRGIANGPRLLAITVLTSLELSDLQEIGIGRSMSDEVLSLARLAKDAGLDGVVCSPQEISTLRQACGPEFLLVTPGIRPVDVGSGDQKRVLTPRQAVDLGSNILVVGRPIIRAANPASAAAAILRELL